MNTKTNNTLANSAQDVDRGEEQYRHLGYECALPYLTGETAAALDSASADTPVCALLMPGDFGV